MNDVKYSSAFAFIGHKIKKFSFVYPEIGEPEKLNIQFEPGGEYDESNGLFVLRFNFSASYGDKSEHQFIELLAEGIFKFENNIPFSEIPQFFYGNSIAIFFPYIRAFVTATTSIGNLKPLILPTLNLTSLAEPLKNATVVKIS